MIAGSGVLPWSDIVWPHEGTEWINSTQARSIPGFSRAVQLLSGLAMQMPLEAYRGNVLLSRPRLLDQPDPDRSRAWFIERQISDWLVHGNAVHWVTARLQSGLPAAVMHCPAERTNVTVEPGTNRLQYWFDGRSIPTEDVVHVMRGQDALMPWRGIGVVEQHMSSLSRIRDQEVAERSSLSASGVPSVVVIAPNSDLSKAEATAAKESWVETYSGPRRVPAVLPKGSEVKPLAWSPHDAQMVEARELSLKDMANIFNLDGYWLGASAGSYTYRSPGPMYLHLLRQTLGPIISLFEGEWGPVWVPHGQQVKFATQAVLGDDMGTTIEWLDKAITAGILTLDEAREYLGKSPLPDRTEHQ